MKIAKLTLLAVFTAGLLPAQKTPRLVEITADHDSRFKVNGHANSTIILEAGEVVTLRITAIKAKSVNRDGSIHGFVLLDKNDEKIPGWTLALQPGTHDFQLTVPVVPGEYKVVCNVICSQDHEMMHMNIKVLPAGSASEISK
jgi:heme/copper-type cytochrome/quinol oxidase subunit 2